MSEPKLLGISGSLRTGSYNTLLVRAAAQSFGGSYTEADLNLPLFNEDIEKADGIPVSVQTLADQIADADAIVISSPEYNQSLTGVLKNGLDWISRIKGSPWKDKPVAIVAAAAGRTGGARGVYALRLAMMPFRANVLPGPEVLVAGAFKEFAEDGSLVTESYQTFLDELMGDLRKAAGFEALKAA